MKDTGAHLIGERDENVITGDKLEKERKGQRDKSSAWLSCFLFSRPML